ncbi:hypothetical protein [Iningainema tapete]|uniref:Uncharacterized protein n=1 Tax=Iningainema tapete BLCC-T55 TaxID=2748662 RepID=A0A8J6XJU8_9CYAN|nr:hypothetical protein [Iningainema tapete]MBD2772146.1 hypothetical protein [Iningainema tapete BLCC-T55]
MNTPVNYTTTPQKSKQKQQPIVTEAQYYDYEAELAQERQDYYHMQYGY